MSWGWIVSIVLALIIIAGLAHVGWFFWQMTFRG